MSVTNYFAKLMKAAAPPTSHLGEPVGGHGVYTAPRLIPRKLMSSRTRFIRPVARMMVHPPRSHPGSPIRDDLTAVEVLLDDGTVRWFGTTKAWITSGLRMAMLVNPRDEVLSRWTRVKGR